MSEDTHLPAVRDSQDAEVIEGQVVDPPPPVYALRVVQTVAKHPHTKTTGRHLAYIPVGAAVVLRRLWTSRTTSRYEKWLRAAEAAGNHEAALEWEKRLADFRRDRHDRRVDMVRIPVDIALAVPKIALGVFIVFASFGCLLAIASKHIAEVATPFLVAARIAEIVAIAFSVSWGPILLAAPWVGVAMLWHVGRAYANQGNGWLAAKKADDETGLIVTADTVVLALQHLPIPALRAAFKEGWKPTFITLPVREGHGYATVYSLPLGVTAEMIADQRKVFARNLHRDEIETWPTAAERAGHVATWVADPGVLSNPAPEYPLLHEGTADVFRGVPGGVAPRGDEISVPIVGNNAVIGGQMGQGKSNACRVIMLGCALDPLAELDVFVFANNGDFDAYRPRLARYVKGLEDDAIAAAVQRLQELYDEVARREQRLADLGAKKVTRQLAKDHRDMRPIVILFSECHELFGHPEYGAVAAELATKTAKRARKTAITMLFDTQSSRKEAIPPKLVELVSVNACFYVKTWRSNDGFLGDGCFAAGIRATDLRPGRDRGTSLITGVSDQQFELLKWHFVEVDDDTGFDAAADVIARAVAMAAPGMRLDAPSVVAAIEGRDLLEDLADVLGDDRVKLRDVVGLLRKHAPAWLPYQKLTAVKLSASLKDAGVRVVNTSGTPFLDPADLRRVLADRAEPEVDDEPDAGVVWEASDAD